MTAFILHDLVRQGRGNVPDQDCLLASIGCSSLLLINIVPGDYAFETHAHSEYLFCMDGELALEDESGRTACVSRGGMIEIPPGLRHRFSAQANAVIVTVAQQDANLPDTPPLQS